MGLLTIAILVGLAALTSQKPSNSHINDNVYSIPQIQSVLHELIAHIPQGDSMDDTVKIKHHGKNHKNLNLINLQNPIVILEDNNLKNKLAVAQHSLKKHQSNANQKVLRDIEEAICETTGRCGCRGNRCNDENKDKDYDNKGLSKLLDSLQSDLENYRSSSNVLRCDCTNGQPHRGFKKHNLRCGCNSKRPNKRTNNNDKGKNYDANDEETSSDDNLKVVFLELNDLLSEKSNYRDYTRTKDLTREGDSQKLADYKSKDEVNETNNNKKGVNPDELFNHYQKFKTTTIKKLVNYILYQKTDIDISRLSKTQQQIVKRLQEQAKSKPVDIDELKKSLQFSIFGPGSAVKVLPHNEKNENIYIPQYAYNKIRASQVNPSIHQTDKEKALKNVHSRSVLPLTKRQKLRLQKLLLKQQSDTAVKPTIWRRSLSEDLQSHGAPFELEIQGLGQVNAK